MRRRRDPPDCQEIYDAALALHNETADTYGGVFVPRRPDTFRAWQAVVDAWEVAEDACLEAGDRERADAANRLGRRLVTAMVAAYRVEHVPHTPLDAARAALQIARRLAARWPDSLAVDQQLGVAADQFVLAGQPRRAAAIRRLIRMRRR